MKKRSALVLAGLLAIGTALAGCSGSQSSGAADAGQPVKEIKIGQIHPLSGAMAVEGQQMRDAVQLAVDEVNEKGGIKSLGGAKVTLIDGDHEGKPEKGVSEVQRLIREGAVGILGTYTSGVTLSATQEAERQKTPFVVTIAAVDDVTERGFKYTFRIQPPASMMAQNFLDLFKSLNEKTGAGYQTAAIAHEDSVFGSSIADYINKNARQAGLQILANIPYSAKAADLTAEVNKIKSVNPDVVIPITYLNDGRLLFQAMKDANFKPKATIGVANGAISNAKFIAEDTALNQYMLDVNYTINPNSEKAKQVKEAYKAKFGSELGPNAAYSYEATKVLLDAIERAGSTDKAKIRDALTQTNYTDHILPQDAIIFDEKGQNKNAQAVMNQIVDGKSEVVFPEKYKQAEPVLGNK